MLSDEQLQDGFRIGDWEVVPARHAVIRNGEEFVPEPKVFRFLMSLARRNGDILTRDEIIEEVWDGRLVSDDPINRVVYQLRKLLGDERPYSIVELVPRVGYRLKEPVKTTEESTTRSGSLPKLLVVALIVLAAVILGSTLTDRGRDDDRATIVIGVMPIVNSSGNPANEYLCSGYKQELLQSLDRYPGITARNIHPSIADRSPSEIRRISKVDYLLSAELFREQDAVTVHYSLEGDMSDEAEFGSVSGPIEQIFGLQEKMAEQVGSFVFGGTAPELLKAQIHTADSAAYDRYMRGLYSFERRGESGNLLAAIELFEESVWLDPEFGAARLMLAQAYALAPVYVSGAQPRVMHKLALDTIDEAVRLDPMIRDLAATVSGYVYHKQKRWSEAEREFVRATTAEVLDSNAFNLYSQLLAGVGRLDESLAVAQKAYDLDPSSTVIASRVALSATWLDNRELAREFFDITRELGDAGATHALGQALFEFREGNVQAAYAAAVDAAVSGNQSTRWIDPVFAALQDPEARPEGLAALDDAAAERDVSYQVEFFVRTYLGDLDGAMDIARLLVEEGEVFELDILWIPEVRPFRQHPAFGQLIEDLRILEYWSDRGCTWSGDRVRCD